MICCVPIWLVQAIEVSGSQNTLWYFFSALAQSAAAFVGVIAVFGVFRFQANASALEDKLRDVTAWITRTSHLRTTDLAFSKEDIKKVLSEFSGDPEKEKKAKASQWVAQIKVLEDAPKKLAQKMAVPMKSWAYVFFASLAFLLWPASGFLGKLVGLLLVIAILLWVAWVLWKTREFIQGCLAGEWIS